MAIIKSVRGFTPKMGKNCYLADNAAVLGDVVMGDDCSIWFGAVLRGDVNPIRIGKRVNIQDNCTVHTTFNDSVAEIVAAGTVVLEKSVLEPNSLYAGVPAKRIKNVNPERLESMIKRIAKDYVMYADWYKEEDQ